MFFTRNKKIYMSYFLKEITSKLIPIKDYSKKENI